MPAKVVSGWGTGAALIFSVGCARHAVPSTPSSVPANSHACAVSWVRELVSSSNASVVGLGAAPDGGVIAATNVYSRLALREDGHKLASFEPVGEGSALVLRLSAAGALTWSARIGAANARVEATALAAKADGSVVIGGHYSGAPRIQVSGRPALALPEAPLGTVTGPVRLFLAYLAPDGTPTQVVTSNDLGALRGVSAVAALGEDLIVLGRFSEPVSFGNGSQRVTLTSNGGSDVFVLRLDRTGQPRWARRLGGVGDDYSNALAVSRQGSLLVSGSFSKPFVRAGAAPPAFGMTFADSPARLEPLSRADAFIAALGGDGSLAWWQAIGGGESHSFLEANRVHSLAHLPDGDAVVVGQAILPLQIGATKAALSVPDETFGGFLARFGPNGALRYVRSLGSVTPNRIAVLPDGDFVVNANGDDEIRYPGDKAALTFASAGLTDMVLARHAPDGALRWVTHFGGDQKEWAGPLAVDAQGALYVEGASHADFSLERRGCDALPVRVVARDHPNSFLFRVEPGADPSDMPRERRQRELRQQAEALRNAAKKAAQSGDHAGALGASQQLTVLLPDDPSAWIELATQLEQHDQPAAIDANLRALTLASRHRSVILEADEQARRDAYLSLSRLGQSVTLPERDCQRLPPATGCSTSLYACVGDSPLRENAVRIGTSAEQASLSTDPTLLPVMPALDRYPGTSAESFAYSHHWFERAHHMDVLISDETSKCRVVTADACLGLIGVVCESREYGRARANTTVDEFYLWRVDDQSVPADP